MDAIRLYIAFLKVSFLTQLEHRVTYVARMIGKLLHFGSGFAIIAILLARFGSIGSWSTYEMLLLYALNILCYSLGATFTMPINNISSRIAAGQIDSILTKPVNPMVFFICQNVSAGYTSNYVISIGIMAVCFAKLEVTITLFKIFWLLLSIIGGALIHAAALTASGVPSFWLVKSSALSRIFYWELANFVEYPLSIYAIGAQVLLTFVLPYAFVNYYPAQMFLSKNDMMFHPVLQYMTPLVGVICFTLAYRFWKFGLDAYQSSGS